MTRKSNYQDLLKIIAMILMVIDHMGLYFFPEYMILRAIGRYSFPVFCFFAGYNFHQKPNMSVLIYGMILYCFTSFVIFQQFMFVNMLFSIFLGQIYLYFFKDHLKNFTSAYIHFVIMSSFYLLTSEIFEYGTLVIGIMILGYCYKYAEQKILITCVITFVSLLHTCMIFGDYFSVLELIVAVIVSGMIFLSLIKYDFNLVINFKLTLITNHLALIYVVHLVVITYIWRYYIII